MNKIFTTLLFVTSLMMVGCDRATLDGLNLKINAEVNSSYDNSKSQSSQSGSQTNTGASNKENNATVTRESNSEPSTNNSVVQVNRADNDPDAPMPFKEIAECSQAGITAKTNEIFYANNAQVKSIDSKNEKQVKEWKQIHAQVEKQCR